MFYEPQHHNHGLPNDPFKSLVVPRPIGWISSQDNNGKINLAPYSFFNAISENPPMVMFSTTNSLENGATKDTLHNVEVQGEFVVNMATYELRDAINLSSKTLPHGESEFLLAKLDMLPSTIVKPPRVKGSPVHLECVFYKSVQLPTSSLKETNRVIIGQVVGIHIDDSVIVEGKIDITKLKPIARLGYRDYAVVENIFSMARP